MRSDIRVRVKCAYRGEQKVVGYVVTVETLQREEEKRIRFEERSIYPVRAREIRQIRIRGVY